MSAVNATTLAQRREFLARAVQAEVRKAGSGAMSPMAQAKVSIYNDELEAIEFKLGGADQVRYKAAFDNFLRVGKRALHTTDLRQLEERATIGVEGVQGGAYPGSVAGFVAPLQYSADVIEATKYASPMLQVATVDETPGGNTKVFPWVNDTAVTASLITESSTLNVQDESTGMTTLAGFKISSGVVKVSMEAVQDAQVYPDLAGFLSRQFGIRFGRYLGQKSTVGAGTTEPTGYVTAAASCGAIVGATGNSGVGLTAYNSLGTADFQTLQAALDYSYWVDATWQVHPTTLAILCGQLDKQGRLLFPEMQNDTQCINGKRVYANAFLSPLPATGPNSPAVSTPVLAGGSFKSVVIRMARPVFVRLDELGAANGQVWFVAYTRVDSNLIPTLSTGPVLTMSCVY